MDDPHRAVPTLSEPTVRVHTSFLAGMAQFRAEGRGQPDDDSVLGQQLHRYGSRWDAQDGFAGYVAALLTDALPDTPRPEGIVASTDLWWISGPTFLGRLSIRHALTDRLRDSGGHIGYEVRPSERRCGIGSELLRLTLKEARHIGLRRVLLTTETTNRGSIGVILANGGVFEDTSVSPNTGRTMNRYWITL